MKTLVVYHKNCMDGLGSVASYSMLEELGVEMVFKAIQHGEPAKEEFMKNLTEDEKKCVDLVFLDFSLDKAQILEACDWFENVMIIDHHKTSEADLQGLEDIANLDLIFDMSKSGAMLTWEHVQDELDEIGDTIPIEIIQYIQDRDLWEWKLSQSKEFSEGFRMAIDRQKRKLYKRGIYDKNENLEINAFLTVCQYLELEEIINIGEVLIEKTDSVVNSKIKLDKLKSVWFGDLNTGTEVLMLNCTENISEIGNAICLSYNKPAMMYFILETGEVIFSLRSTDDLHDVSKIAKAYGGGGHRNACGFKGDLNLLGMFLSGNPEAKEL
jgi:oligoribonuclease NrnB/cAMP/cGMP phosphodiesterase (DHH superfamily)